MIKKISLYILAGFFVFAGINHFLNPAFYLPLIPPYFPAPELINWVSGIAEIVLGVLLLIPKTRGLAVIGLIILMIAFIPAHVHHIQAGGCLDSVCVPVWVTWVRLLIVHPVLLLWIFRHRK